VPAEVIGSVMVLQALEGRSDREAISALRRDIAWKAACGPRLHHEGFHPTVLVYWRNRLRSSDRPRRSSTPSVRWWRRPGTAVAHSMSDEHAQIRDFEAPGATSVDETTLVEQHAALTASGRGPTK
jgi:hypothetical protein